MTNQFKKSIVAFIDLIDFELSKFEELGDQYIVPYRKLIDLIKRLIQFHTVDGDTFQVHCMEKAIEAVRVDRLDLAKQFFKVMLDADSL